MSEPGEKLIALARDMAKGSTAAPTEWETPVPLTDTAAPPTFPLEFLPERLREYAEEVTNAYRTKPDLVGVFMLATLSAALRGRWQVTDGGAHVELVALHVVLVSESGGKKSPVLAACTKPLIDLQAKLHDELGPAVAVAQSKRRSDEKRLATLEADAAKETDSGEVAKQRDQLATKLHSEPMPAVPRLFTSDATPEKLEALMAANGGAMSWLSAEGGFFSAGARYSKSDVANIEVILKGYSGEPLATDRMTRDVYVPRAALTVGVGVQREPFTRALRNVQLMDQGLLARIFVTWPALPETDNSQGPSLAVSERIQNRYSELVEMLYRESEKINENKPRLITIDQDADNDLREWFAETKNRRSPGGDLSQGNLKKWALKLDGGTFRLAALFAIAESPKAQSVNRLAAKRAIAFARYFAGYAPRIYDEAGASDDIRNARKCLEAIRKADESITRQQANDPKKELRHWKEWPAAITRRDVFSSVRGTEALSGTEEVGHALKTLESFGWLRETLSSQHGSYRYEVHPQLFAAPEPAAPPPELSLVGRTAPPAEEPTDTYENYETDEQLDQLEEGELEYYEEDDEGDLY